MDMAEEQVETEIQEDIDLEIPESSADGFGGLEKLLEEEIKVDPDAREDLRDWEGVLPREGIESIDIEDMGPIDTARTKLGRSFKNGKLGGLYVLGTFGGSFAGHTKAAELALESTGTTGEPLAELGVSGAAVASFIATSPVVGHYAMKAGEKITETVMPEEAGRERGHIYSGGYEDQIAELLEEADATEFIELGGTTYEMDADVPWNIRYLGDAEEDVFYNIGWEHNEEENKTYIEMDAMVHWNIDEVDLENFDLDNFDMWRFRATKETSPEEWKNFKYVVTRDPASEDEVQDYFEEAYRVLDEAGYLNKDEPFSRNTTYEGRRKGHVTTKRLQDDSR